MDVNYIDRNAHLPPPASQNAVIGATAAFAAVAFLLPKAGILVGIIGLIVLIKGQEAKKRPYAWLALAAGLLSIFLLTQTDWYESKSFGPYARGYFTQEEKNLIYYKVKREEERIGRELDREEFDALSYKTMLELHNKNK